ncbi:MAG: hypothetical protein HY530_08135 [Chloroflexi bacterium]|nr:hypothetical protein [Chloroflexota bacterium]
MTMTDFWWLTPEQANKYVYVELVHHQPLTDEDDAPHQSFNNPCFAGIQNISKWCNKYQNTNVYRSLKIWPNNSKGEALLGPFVVDIDNSKNLDNALTVTRNAVSWLIKCYNLKESDIRLFFTGHKGFNIEILPSALGLAGTPSGQDNKADSIRKAVIKALQQSKNVSGGYSVGYENGRVVYRDLNTGKYVAKRDTANRVSNSVSAEGTIIDPPHEYTRLHNSINEWIEHGVKKARRKIGLTLSELNSLPLKEIVDRSIV